MIAIPIDKPKNCKECPFTCEALQFFNGKDRPQRCPLIEIDEPKVGRWIRAEGELICSICEYPAEFNPLSSDFIETNYCPNCGAKMKGE